MSGRVALRRLRREDAAQVLAWRTAPEVARYMYSDREITPREHSAWLEAALGAPDRAYWIVELDGVAVGLANLARIDREAGRCDWAFYLADPAVRGRSVGAAVEYLILRHVFETLGLDKLWCEVLADNTAVVRLHERFGFTREALLRAHVRKGGRRRDVVGLGLLATEWPAVRARAEAQLAMRLRLEDLALEP